jgi:hypothetical protein
MSSYVASRSLSVGSPTIHYPTVRCHGALPGRTSARRVKLERPSCRIAAFGGLQRWWQQMVQPSRQEGSDMVPLQDESLVLNEENIPAFGPLVSQSQEAGSRKQATSTVLQVPKYRVIVQSEVQSLNHLLIGCTLWPPALP